MCIYRYDISANAEYPTENTFGGVSEAGGKESEDP